MSKIAVLHRYPINQVLGTNASFLEFLKSLKSKGNDVYYFTFKDASSDTKYDFINYIELPFTFDRSNNKDKLIKTILWTLLVPFFVAYSNIKAKYDLIYCDDSVPYYGFFTKLLNLKTKVFIRLGDLQSGYTFADKSPKLFSFILSIEVFMWKKLDGIVAISEPFKNFLIKKMPTMKSKIFVVEESVNIGNIRVSKKQKTESCTFLFHGALLSCKGVSTLLLAFKDFVAKYSDSKLIIAGGGGEEMLLKKLVEDLSIPNVQFTGWYNHLQLGEILSNSDISIVMRSTNMANNFVVTTCLLENWSYKKPVIAPNLESFRGVIIDGKNGILFKVGDKDDLVKKMEYLFKHRVEWKYLGENGFLTAKNVFDHKLIANKMAEILVNNLLEIPK